MISVEVENDTLKQAERLLAEIPNGVQRAMVSAFNRALQEGRTAGTREVTKQYTIQAKRIRPTIAMHRANKNNLNAELVSRGKRMPLEYFAHKPQTDTTGAKRKQVRVAVKKGGMKPLGQGFIYKGMVLQRLGDSRLPVQKKFGPSIPSIIDNEQVVEVMENKMIEAVEKRLLHETERLLAGYGK